MDIIKHTLAVNSRDIQEDTQESLESIALKLTQIVDEINRGCNRMTALNKAWHDEMESLLTEHKALSKVYCKTRENKIKDLAPNGIAWTF